LKTMNQLELLGKEIKILVNDDLSMTVIRRGCGLLCESSKSHTPFVTVCAGNAQPRGFPLASAKDISTSPFYDGKYRGHTICLKGFGEADVVLELIFAIDAATDECMIQIAQASGEDTVVSIEHLYRFEKPVTDGGYMVLPHGSGYLIPAECPDELPGEGHKGGLIGARWTLPMFGMVRNKDALLIIVETWWDCEVEADHVPGKLSALDFRWLGSLGKLDYPRRFILRFDKDMDYVGMAKFYRDYAKKQGLLRTLEEKAAQTPAIQSYAKNVLLRWLAWNTEDGPAVLADIHKLQGMGFGINFFFPKWSSAGYSSKRNTATKPNSLWQAYLHLNPVSGGWQSLVEYADAVHKLGCLIQCMIILRTQDPAGPEYDEGRWPHDAHGLRLKSAVENQPSHNLSTHDALTLIIKVLDNVKAKGFKMDVMYFDGYSAYNSMPEDFTKSHPVTRRQIFETQNKCFAEARGRGIMPAGEVARFWCMADCDYFFFTDWSSDRLTNLPTKGAPTLVGKPIPLFQLVFHDCYMAGFSGGGYALYAPGYDWWSDRAPRLYELLFTAAPVYNWLPDGYMPVRDWNSAKAQRRWAWLKRWSAYYCAIATSEMVSHQFLSPDRKRQRIEFANGVIAEFNMAENKFRVTGMPDFDGQWETPPEL
jgi:hypothetical protein